MYAVACIFLVHIAFNWLPELNVEYSVQQWEAVYFGILLNRFTFETILPLIISVKQYTV